jgi:hypothetical protein
VEIVPNASKEKIRKEAKEKGLSEPDSLWS